MPVHDFQVFDRNALRPDGNPAFKLRAKPPARLSGLEPFQRENRLFDTDVGNFHMSADQRTEQHARFDRFRLDEVGNGCPGGVGDAHSLQPQPRPGKEPRRDIAGYDHLAAGELAAVILD